MSDTEVEKTANGLNTREYKQSKQGETKAQQEPGIDTYRSEAAGRKASERRHTKCQRFHVRKWVAMTRHRVWRYRQHVDKMEIVKWPSVGVACRTNAGSLRQKPVMDGLKSVAYFTCC